MILYLIGNGFDLAHGLPTSYGDFMDSIKKSIAEVVCELDKLKIYEAEGGHRDFNNGYIVKKLTDDKIDKWIELIFNKNSNKLEFSANTGSFYYRDLFKKHNKDKDSNWADLEALYFELINIHINNEARIKIINEEFEHLKLLLTEYLLTQVEQQKPPPLKDSIKQNILTQLQTDSNVQFITFNYTHNVLQEALDIVKSVNSNNKNSEDILSGLAKPPEIIHIHGDLINKVTPIIFGYGDDNSKKYENIQNKENDELLKNIKTFNYQRNNKYKDILKLLKLHKNIKVISIGHSLSSGDKTLLKTIFTHKNVSEIEIAYHNNEDEYFKNIYSLSRIIDNNELMREKVVSLEDALQIV